MGNMLLPANIPFQQKLIRTSVILVYIVMTISLLVIAGWAFNIDFLIRPLYGLVAMNPVTAISLLMASVSFLLLSGKSITARKSFLGYTLAISVLGIGLLKILDSTLLDIPFDRLLFRTKLDRADQLESYPNSMAINTAISLVLTGLALLIVHSETPAKKMPGQFIALVIAFASFLSILLYLYQVPDFSNELRHIPMAIHTAVCFLALAVACLFIHPDKGVMGDFTSQYAGSIMGRILIPVAILIPVILGFLRLILYWHGRITTELGVAVLVLSIILIFFSFIRYSIGVLNKKDYQREQAEIALRASQEKLKRFNEELEQKVEIKTTEIKQSEEKFRTLIERISDGFLALDKNWNYTYANQKIGQLTQRDPKSLIGKNVWEEFPSAIDSDTYKAFLKAMNEQEYISNSDYYAPLDLWQENHIYPSPDGISVFIKDVTIKKRAEQEMLRVNEELHRLSSYLQGIREEERISIAREIHDELGQQLTGLKMYVYNLGKNLGDPQEDSKGLINDITELTGEIVESVRRISANLRPPILDDLGLVPALEWQSKEMEKRAAVKVNFESELFLLDLPQHITTGLFRIYQEALNNAVKYAQAKTISGKLEIRDDCLWLEIADDGIGMNIAEQREKKTFGLLGIQERTYMMKGKYELNSQPGEGTRIMVTVPLKEIIN